MVLDWLADDLKRVGVEISTNYALRAGTDLSELRALLFKEWLAEVLEVVP